MIKSFIQIFCCAFLLLIVSQTEVTGCQRYATPPVRVAFQEAEIVFVGKVIKSKNLKNKDIIPDNWQELTFEVTINYKGVKDRTVKVLTADYGTCEGIKVKKGESWLIFAKFNNDVETYETTKGFEQFRGYKIEDENKDVIETIEKASENQLPTQLSIEIANAVNPYIQYSGEVELSLTGQNFVKKFSTKDGFFNLKNIDAGKYKARFTFKNKVLLNYASDDFKVVSNEPEVIETEIVIKNKELSFLFLEAADDY